MDNNRLKWLYLIGFFLILALPLLNLPPWFSPPDWGKTIVFRIILAILIFIFLWQALSKKYYPNPAPEQSSVRGRSTNKVALYLLASLLGVFFLATIFSLDPHFSFWGSPYRSGGFLNFAFYIIFAILAFLILRKSDWQKIWDFAIIIGIFVSIIAIFQQFGIFSKVFIPFSGRPPSTVGGPIFLAIYLLLLSFLTFSFGIKSRVLVKKIFYFISFLLFLFVIVLITQTRAVFIGLAAGFLYFLFFYPKRLIFLKVFAGVLLILGGFGLYFLKSHPEVYSTQNDIVRGTINRILSIPEGEESRISAWKVSLEALKTKSILGYGPENFSIGFDKFYDPALPGIEKMPGVVHSWWDRAHNFVFDIGVTAGVPALIIYLSLFGVLFWQLQKLKYYPNLRMKSESTNDSVITHGIQATFIGYLVANFFSFDTFSTYLISFLVIGYSFHLIYYPNPAPEQVRYGAGLRIASEPRTKNEVLVRGRSTNKNLTMNVLVKLGKYRGIIIFICFWLLVWFIWVFNVKPFQINTKINIGLQQLKNGDCQGAISQMEEILPKKSFLDNYLRLNYVTIINQCLNKEKLAGGEQLAKRAREILKENIKIRPYYTRNWLLLGQYTNILIENGEKNLKDEANSYFEKANQLSPKRQEVLTEWIKTDLLTGEYQSAREKSEKCLALNGKLADCYWLLGLAQAYLGNLDVSDYYILAAKDRGYPAQSKESLLQLTKAYIETENYPGLVKTYSDLISLEPSNPQHHASLAVVYQKLGEIDKAKKEAQKVLELQPEAKGEVEEFLKTLE